MTLKQLCSLVLISSLFLGALVNVGFSVSKITATIAISPRIVYQNSGIFKVNITVTDADFMFMWQVNLTYNKDVLKLLNFTAGDFFDRQPMGILPPAKRIEPSWALLCVTTKGEYQGLSGSGNLAILEFEILGNGISNIQIEQTNRTYLQRQTSPYPPPNFDMQPYTVKSGIFLNTITPPTSSFDYSPKPAGENQPITFDASASSAASPYGIVEYFWDFDDGTNATVTEPITQHTFTTGGFYDVKLTIIDNATAPPEVESLFNSIGMPREWYELFGTSQQSIAVAIPHDISLTGITISKQEVSAGEHVTITVTLLNGGSESEDGSVTAYYGDTEISTQQYEDLDAGEDRELTFDWDTSGVTEGVYRIKAIASSVEGEINEENNEVLGGTVNVKAGAPGLPILLIAGVAVAAIVVIVIISAVVFLMRRKKT